MVHSKGREYLLHPFTNFNRPFHVFFLTFAMDKLEERLKFSKIARFESILLKRYGSLKDVSLSNLAILLILRCSFQWCRQIYPNLFMSKVAKTVKRSIFTRIGQLIPKSLN